MSSGEDDRTDLRAAFEEHWKASFAELEAVNVRLKQMIAELRQELMRYHARHPTPVPGCDTCRLLTVPWP
jgi:hypothetical protein